MAIEPQFANYDSPARLDDMHCFRPWSYTPIKHWAETCQHTQMPIFINEFGGPGVYGWGDADADGVGGVCGTNGEAAMFGTTNTSEPCSPVDYADTYHVDTHARMSFMAQSLSSSSCVYALAMCLQRPSTDAVHSIKWNGMGFDPCNHDDALQVCNTIFISP